MDKDITIHLTDRDGNLHKLNAPVDMQFNLMDLCKVYKFPVEGTCGGMALCASCQCYVTSNHSIPEKSEDEKAMLAEAFNVRENSRLGCQIFLTPELNGLSVTLAPEE